VAGGLAFGFQVGWLFHVLIVEHSLFRVH
jgi:hypothetical protein